MEEIGARLAIMQVGTETTSLSAMLEVSLSQEPVEPDDMTARIAIYTDAATSTDTVTVAYNYQTTEAEESPWALTSEVEYTVDFFSLQYDSDTN